MVKSFFKKTTKSKFFIPIIVVFAVVLVFTTMLLRKKTINIVIDGNHRAITTFRSTVGQFLRTNDVALGPKDKINYTLDSKLKDEQYIFIKRAVNVNLKVDGKEVAILSAEDDIASMLKVEGITLKEMDKIEPELEKSLSEGMNIKIVRVETKTITEKVSVKFKEVVKVNKSLSNTKRQVTREGKNGEKEVTILLTYEDGKEVSRQTIGEKVIVAVQDKVIVQGTFPHMPVSRSGSIMPYKKVFTCRATAYWAVRGVGRTYTASGRKAVWNPDGYSTIAVDPKIIPYGTKLFVEGYGFAIAADTGTAIKGNKVDVYFNTYNQACNWGAKYVKVYVLD